MKRWACLIGIWLVVMSGCEEPGMETPPPDLPVSEVMYISTGGYLSDGVFYDHHLYFYADAGDAEGIRVYAELTDPLGKVTYFDEFMPIVQFACTKQALYLVAQGPDFDVALDVSYVPPDTNTDEWWDRYNTEGTLTFIYDSLTETFPVGLEEGEARWSVEFPEGTIPTPQP